MPSNLKTFVPQFIETDKLSLMFQAVESAQTGIVITDPHLPDNPIIYSNPAFSKITGYGADEISGKNCRFLQGMDTDQQSLHDLRKAIKEERAVTVVLLNYKKNGTPFYNELILSPVREQHDVLIAFVGIQNDITSRVESENRVSDFFSMISHELRTPITSMKGSFALLAAGKAGELSERATNLASVGLAETDRLIRLLNDILDIKKLESGKFEINFENLEPQELVERSIAITTGYAAQHKVQLVADIGANDIIRGDKDRLIQILSNLISNAIKFSDAEQSITISTAVQNGLVRFSVKDKGPGIDPANVPKLFRMFQQVGAVSQSKGGTGLGLAICKSLTEQHGGSVGVDTELGKGATFWFEIPCA